MSKIVVVFLFACLIGGGLSMQHENGGRHALRRRLPDKIPADGEVTFELTSDPILTANGNNCDLQVDGRVFFEGTVVGGAMGTTHAKVFAACDEVGAKPPGFFRDIFQSDLEFVGIIDNIPATADITYRGKTAAGGDIEDAQFKFSNGAIGLLRVDATVADGGTYEGEFTQVG